MLDSTPAQARLTADLTAIDGKRLTVGGLTIDATAAALPPALAAGERIRVRVATTPVGGAWQADAVRRADLPSLPVGPWAALANDDREAEIEGVIEQVQGQRLRIRGLVVDASVVGTGWRLGDRVEVKGRLQGGVLVAQRIEVEDDAKRSERGFELHATVEVVGAGTFTARGITAAYEATAVTLAVGDRVEAKLQRTADGRWRAVSIEVEGSQEDEQDDTGESDDDETR